MTSTPTSISFTDLADAGKPFLASLAAKSKALHIYADASGDVQMQALVNDFHSGEGGLSDAQDAFIGLFPNDTSKPQPQDGGGPNKN